MLPGAGWSVGHDPGIVHGYIVRRVQGVTGYVIPRGVLGASAGARVAPVAQGGDGTSRADGSRGHPPRPAATLMIRLGFGFESRLGRWQTRKGNARGASPNLADRHGSDGPGGRLVA